MSNVAVATIGGSTVTSRIRLANVRVQKVLNQPRSCSFRIGGSAPAIGADFKLGLGDTTAANLLFAGCIQRVAQGYELQTRNLCWDVTCQDYTYLLNRRRPIKTYTAQSASTIAADLISTYTSGFTSTNVQASLAAVTIVFDGSKDLASCLNALAATAGAYWYVDVSKDLHFFTSEASSTPDTIDGTGTKLQLDPPLTYVQDASQLRTRIYVKGQSASLQQQAGGGSTVLFLSDISQFSAAGGSAISGGGQILTYTGKSPTYGATTAIARPAPATAPTATRLATGAGTPDTTGNWFVVYTFVYSNGTESLPSPTSSAVAITGPNDGITLSNVPIGGTGVVKRWIYFKKAGGSTFDGNTSQADLRYRINDNTTTNAGSFDAQTGGSTLHPPSTNTTGYVAGSTSIYVSDPTQFNPTGGTVQYGARTFTYTAVTGSALTGIPASGTGSIAATIAPGDTLAYVPTAADYYLTGIPPSGAGSIAGIAAGTDTIAARPAPSDPGVTRLATGAGTPDATGSWQVEVSFGYSDGTESLPSAADTIVITGPNDGFTVPLPIGDANVTKRYVYFKKPSDTFKRPATGTINDNTTTSVNLDAQLGGGTTAPQSSAASYPSGSTYLYVNDATKFALTGGTVQYGTRTFTYTAISALSGVAFLSGIPASSTGSIAATIAVGDSVTCLSTGIGLAKGDTISLWVQRDDTTAQTAVAALEGGDGIHEHLIVDGSIASILAAQQLADAELTLFKSALVSVTYATRDTKSEPGKTVTIALPSPQSLSASVKIQRVTIDQIDQCGGRLGPRYTVEAASTKVSLEDLLRQLAEAA